MFLKPFFLKKEVKDFLMEPPKGDTFVRKAKLRRFDLTGQEGQPIKVNEEIFKNRIANGFFIEAGAHDGVSFSNTLFYELKQNWTGLLVEANPDLYQDLLKQKRKAWLAGTCLSTKKKPEIVDFDAAGMLGGIINNGRKPGIDETKKGSSVTLGSFRFKADGYGDRFPFKRQTVKLVCLPLYSMLMALGNPTVHYFRFFAQLLLLNALIFHLFFNSLDVEGAELPIIKSLPLDKVDIKVIQIEAKQFGRIFPGSFKELSDHLTSNGYEFHSLLGGHLDALFIKKGFLQELEIPRDEL